MYGNDGAKSRLNFESAETATSADTAGDASLWTDLREPASPQAFGRAWLSITARTFPAVRQGTLLLIASPGAPLEPVARWAAQQSDNAARLSESGANALATAVKEQRAAVEGQTSEAGLVYVGIPIVTDATVRAAVLVEAEVDSPVTTRRLLRHLQWASAWVEVYVRRGEIHQSSATTSRARTLVNIVNATLFETRFDDAARTLASMLARDFGCERVGIGLRRRLRTKLIAASQSAEIDARFDLAQLFEAAMDEAIDQQAILIAPAPREPSRFIAYANEALVERISDCNVMTVPLVWRGESFGALSMIRKGIPFGQTDLDLVDGVAAATAAVLFEKEQSDRNLIGLIALRARRFLEMLTGPKHLAIKCGGAAALMILAVLLLVHDDYRVHARGTVHGEVRRIVSAPFDGYVRSQFARAGETVRSGDLLAELQDNDLVLDRLRHIAQRRQYSLEYDRALSRRDLAQVNIARAQVEQKDAEIELTTQMLERAQLRAPFDGIVVSGDLSQSIGKPVSRGDTLFELAPLERYRVTLIVPEADIGVVRAGQQGNLLLSALPEQPFAVEITSVTPVAKVSDGVNGFEVLATLKQSDPRIRPSMEGLAKIETVPARLIWIWTHSITQWVRVKLWAWLP
jgi:hypothetical protein